MPTNPRNPYEDDELVFVGPSDAQKSPPVFAGVEVGPTRIYPQPSDEWVRRLYEDFSRQPGTVERAAEIDSRVGWALPPGYEEDAQGNVYRRVPQYYATDETGRKIYKTELQEADPRVVQRYRESRARRILDESMRNNILRSLRTTGRRHITPAEYMGFAKMGGHVPNTLDTWIPYFGMEAARQQTARDAANRAMILNALQTGAAIDRQRDDYWKWWAQQAAQERLARINALPGIANILNPPPPPYAPPTGHTEAPAGDVLSNILATTTGTTLAQQQMYLNRVLNHILSNHPEIRDEVKTMLPGEQR